jgi:Reverse transcriptase (RNA-dependent DNA polymerase)
VDEPVQEHAARRNSDQELLCPPQDTILTTPSYNRTQSNHNDGLPSEHHAILNKLAELIVSIETQLDNGSKNRLKTKILKEIAHQFLLGSRNIHPIEEWFHSVFPSYQRIDRQQHPFINLRPNNTQNAPQSRIQDYAATQELYKTDRKAAFQRVVGARHETTNFPARQIEEYWANIMETDSLEWGTNHPNPGNTLNSSSIWIPISINDITKHEPHKKTAAGRDGITATQWASTPAIIRAIIFNFFLLSRSIPLTLLSGRTTFIPKTENAKNPDQFRPITVTSIIVRQFHKILADRIATDIPNRPEQKGFIRGVDGIGFNVTLLNNVIHDARTKRRELHLAILDLQKAFDSISQKGIMATLEEKNISLSFQEYMHSVFQNSSTRFFSKGWRSREIFPKRGVKQGDPLSGLLFNIGMDRVLAELPGNIGYWLNGSRIKAIAYADDVVLIASSRPGLQLLLKNFTEKVNEFGLTLNIRKSYTGSIVPSGKTKKIRITQTPFHALGSPLACLTIGDKWKYLGVPFDLKGISTHNISIDREIRLIDRGPLKPYQKIEFLRSHLLPSTYHQAVLGKFNLKQLRSLDVISRRYCRKWLHLPHDTPNGLFHVPIGEGGIGICQLASHIIILKRIRIARAEELIYASSATHNSSIRNDLASLLTEKANTKRNEVSTFHNTTDGRELRHINKAKPSIAWIRDKANLISGQEFIQFMRIRAGALPSLMRTSRGRRGIPQNIHCRAGCDTLETAAHIIQNCPRTHGGRCLRHDSVVNFIAAMFQRKGSTVLTEFQLVTSTRIYKPDLIIDTPHKILILDVQIISGSGDLSEAHNNKKRKYSVPNIFDAVRAVLNRVNAEVKVIPVTLTWKGIWYHKTLTELKTLQIPKEALSWITLRVLRGTSITWNNFLRSTQI